MSDKIEKLKKAVEDLNKNYGQGSVMKLGDTPQEDVPSIPSGSLTLDDALGVGGYPRGRVVEIFGSESAGKTTLAIHAIAEAQKAGGTAAFIDAEHAFDCNYAEKLGVDIENLYLSQPDNGEQALEITNNLIKSGGLDILVIDSVAALTPKAEIDGEMGDARIGLQARLMSQALRKLTANISNTKTCCIFINQIREKIGVMFGCFHYDTLVNFTDGRSIPIGKVVDERIKGNVWCFNSFTRTIESKPIVNWFDNGKVTHPNQFIHIQTESTDGRGRFGVTCTPSHRILTDVGWTEAQDLSINHCLISKYNQKKVIKPVSIKQIRFASDRQMRDKRKFDICVADNHNYMVGGKYNGLIVHNSPETTSGGNALKFYSSVRLDIRKSSLIKDSEGAVKGIQTRVKIVKNKVAPPFRNAEFDVIYGEGISKTGEIIELGVKYGIIKKSGAWFSYNETRLGQGKDNVRNLLLDNPELTEELEEKIKKEMK